MLEHLRWNIPSQPVPTGSQCSPKRENCYLRRWESKSCFQQEDVAAYAIRSIDDPRTLNKILSAPFPLNMTLWLVYSALVLTPTLRLTHHMERRLRIHHCR